jgi:hypothetical protein
MADDLKNRGAQDRTRINIHEPYEVEYWTRELGVTRSELERFVTEHGVSADKVREAITKAQAH